jgi:hypothetical protein
VIHRPLMLPRVAYEVVSLSVTDGAGAADLGHLLSQALGYRLIDEEIIAGAAVEAGVEPEVVADVERRKSILGRLIEGMAQGGAVSAPLPPDMIPPASDELRKAIRIAIDEVASAGQVVVVAHAASFALAGREDVLRVLVTASDDTRKKRIAADRGIDEGQAGSVLKRSDAGRSDYLKRFYGIGEEKPSHYDLVINTDKFTAGEVARVIVGVAQ